MTHSVPEAYRQTLLEFSAQIRDPQRPLPDALPKPAMSVYQRLFFNNISRFLSQCFPIYKQLLSAVRWQQEVRGFMQHYHCRSPLFYDISAEYIAYVQSDLRPVPADDPPFLLELLHYEWIELALSIDPADITPQAHAIGWDEVLEISPLAWLLAYQFPVHQLCAEYQPQEPPEQPTWILAYRNLEDKVRFSHLNLFSARLFQALASASEPLIRILQTLAEEAGNLPPGRELSEDQADEWKQTPFVQGAWELIHGWQQEGIVLGSRPKQELYV
ncbi:HvfC family RiPP maturation protein [Nitrincola tapanii]|uniref:DUF2063 domain-containing protein n=1 Tax=Nitrincola tapanii TaxID=1708751 RepID=A0A5A9WA65_9GAMM|nr:putative DNA-binding domain-containing protein [Nitrincola tapanii]KAA0876311.1 DUF2063 domain-containing protein [Nitrincola tapanii]